MAEQVEATVRARRAADLRELGARLVHAHAASREGGCARVLVERPGRGTTEDHLAVVVDDSLRVGSLVDVVLQRLDGRRMRGRVV
jgi:tRNA A37 methylthiotransferase MiaB